jgi:hypothetical protein
MMVGALVGLGLVGMSSGEAEAQSASASAFQSNDRGGDDGAVQRDGLFGGFSFGRGSIDVDCGDCAGGGGRLSEALSLEGHVGFMLTDQIALIGEHWTIRYNARGGALFNDNAPHLVAQHVSSLGAQVFLTDSIWVRTGLGIGWHISDGDYAKRVGPSGQVQAVTNGESSAQRSPGSSELEEIPGPGASYFAAVGWEVAHSRSFVAEIQLRAASTQRADDAYEVRNVGLNVGASWY